MTQIAVSDVADAALRRFGIIAGDDGLMWWGALASLQRADDAHHVFSPDRRAHLDVLARRGCENPSDLTPRDRAFYFGALAEVVSVVATEVGGDDASPAN